MFLQTMHQNSCTHTKLSTPFLCVQSVSRAPLQHVAQLHPEMIVQKVDYSQIFTENAVILVPSQNSVLKFTNNYQNQELLQHDLS